MSEEKFYFSLRKLLFIVSVTLAIGSAPLVFDREEGGLFGSIMSIGGSPMIGYLLYGATFAAGLFHLPNLVRALAQKPAVTIGKDYIHLHQFPSRTLPVSEVEDVSAQLGSMLLKLKGNKKRWVNLKIVETSDECIDAVKSAITATQGNYR